MRTLYIDCSMGAAGDMLTGALLELLDPEQQEEFVNRFNSLGIPDVKMVAGPSEKCGIRGTHISILVHGHEEDADMHGEGGTASGHAPGHAHHHEHSHNSMAGIEHIISDHLGLPETVRQDILAVYGNIAEAESQVHGVPVTEIHFHEVGSMDAVADVTAVCLLMHMIGPDEVIVSPVNTGSGTVRCAHGILPVPAPATAHILRGIPVWSNGIQSELCTPTGAALLRHFSTGFGSLPAMTCERIGYGMGKKDFETANCVRIMLGERAEQAGPQAKAGPTDDCTPDADHTASRVLEFQCNIDDMTGEEIGFAMDQLLKAGALDVWTENIGMKKCRPGIKLCLLARPEEKERFYQLIFRYTTSIGIRICEKERAYLTREYTDIETEDGSIRRKTVSGYGVTRTKIEYDDAARIAERREMDLRRIRHDLARKK